MVSDSCADCGATFVPVIFGTGYATLPSEDDKRICYACCAVRDAHDMEAKGKATLYLRDGEVVNWPGTFRIPVQHKSDSRGRGFGSSYRRSDVWFSFKGQRWWGVCQGHTDLIHCRRLKSKL